MTRYPVLVYGTLRPGGSNYGYFLAGSTISESTVTLEGFRMLGGMGFPYVIAGMETEKIVGTLCEIDAEDYEDVVSQLDMLEGYLGHGDDRNHYDRILVDVDSEGETVKAWMYIASQHTKGYYLEDLPIVESGDWLTFYETQKRNSSFSSWVR